ncbi:M10 family metallopeptidase C-terminal domain-containing protein [Inquilinus sp. OTU3971]|uniref:M10 family metallopeptidase C-terminal domain-containing protein n=1 Tax=Inquilinus sp. OTU3971 TaxID=3043855 RepID=UPI00313DBE1E
MANYIGTDAGEAIVGGAGDDRIIGRGGNDTLTGGAGNDVFVYDTRGFGFDIITDFNTNGDRIDLSYLHVTDFASLRYVLRQDGNDVVIDLGYDSSGFVGDDNNEEIIRIKNINLISLSDADFVLNTSTSAITIKGTFNNDTLFGGAGNDTISGGDDQISGEFDADTLIGGAGNDRIIGGFGYDQLVGGAGNDIFVYDRDGFDLIADFDTNGDRIDLSSLHIADLASLLPFMRQDGADVVITFAYDEGIRLRNVALSSLSDTDFVFNTSPAWLVVTGEGVLFGGNGNDYISGSNSWDTLVGGPGDDRLIGYESDDRLMGGVGDDTLIGGQSDDELMGGAGDDRLIGSQSDDELIGGAGNDIFAYIERYFGRDTITDFDTNGDRIDLSYLNVADISYLRPFMAQDGSDVIIDLGSEGYEERIRIENVTLASLSNADFVFNTSTTGLAVNGRYGVVTFGGAGNDRIIGGTGRLVGGAGNDIFAYQTNHVRSTILDFNTNGDRIDLSAVHVPDLGSLLPFMTQDGADVLIAFGDGESIRLLNVALGSLGTADFIFDTSTGDDIVYGISQYGTSHGDVLFGGAGNDKLFGRDSSWSFWPDGNDLLLGGSGDDELDGDTGIDRLVGGDGDDLFEGGVGADRLDGGAGIDTARYYGSNGGVTVDLSTGATSGGDAWGDTLVSIENITGSFGDDILIGNAGANVLKGLDGDDLLRGGAGADRLEGGFDTDTVSYYIGSIGVTIDLSANTGSGGDAQGDTLFGFENVSGSQGNDRVTGNIFANILQGWNGDDVLQGGAGADRLDGGGGIDTASYAISWVGVTADLSTGTGRGGEAEDDILVSIENLDGSQKADILIGNAGANALKGGDGNDTLRGGGGADRLDGGTGIDTAIYSTGSVGVAVDLSAGTGSGGDAQGDILVSIENLDGSQANDQLTGNADANLLKGLAGADVLRGGVGADRLDGGAGIDTASYYTAAGGVSVDLGTHAGSGGDAQGDVLISIENLTGGQGKDTLAGDAGVNILQGWGGDDTLRGGTGADRLDGGAGSDTASYYSSWAGVSVNLASGAAGGAEAQGDILVSIENVGGSQNADTLIGNAGANTLQGWGGNDLLRGGAGKDTLTGGAGADRFVFTASGDSVVGANADRITDFSRAQLDKIDLSAIDANSAVAGDQGFSFIGSGLFTRHAGELRFTIGSGATTIAGDLNGDGISDFQITLDGAVSLQASDFAL